MYTRRILCAFYSSWLTLFSFLSPPVKVTQTFGRAPTFLPITWPFSTNLHFPVRIVEGRPPTGLHRDRSPCGRCAAYSYPSSSNSGLRRFTHFTLRPILKFRTTLRTTAHCSVRVKLMIAHSLHVSAMLAPKLLAVWLALLVLQIGDAPSLADGVHGRSFDLLLSFLPASSQHGCHFATHKALHTWYTPT